MRWCRGIALSVGRLYSETHPPLSGEPVRCQSSSSTSIFVGGNAPLSLCLLCLLGVSKRHSISACTATLVSLVSLAGDVTMQTIFKNNLAQQATQETTAK